MDAFTKLDAIACPLDRGTIDTDQLIPARFMVRSRAEGYGGFLFHDVRFAADGSMVRDFALNQPRFAGAKILVAPRNFGTGSSREAAVYALWDYGIRCVIAPSFGDIFASNAAKNGLLAAAVTEAEVEMLLAYLVDAAAPKIAVDLETQTLTAGTQRITFCVDPVRRLQLLNGWDDIDLSLRHQNEIRAYKSKLSDEQPWALLEAAKRG